MKKKVGVFIVLVFLFSACEVPAASELAAEAGTTPTLGAALVPASTLESQPPSRAPFCQGEPEHIELGSSTKITVFSLPVNQPIAVYLDSRLAATGTTNGDGYASVDVSIPANETIGLHQISVSATGTPIIITCQISFWSDLIPSPTFFPASPLTPTPALSSDQLTMTATQQSLENRLGENCRYGSAEAVKLSPHGQWAEAICGYDSIIIIRTDKTKEWSLSSDSLIGPSSEHFIRIFHWSNDGAYAYVYANPHTDGYWEPFHQASDLFRLNLETGQIGPVLSGNYYSFSFSPNDRRLAYIVTDQSPVILNIRDLQTGINQSYPFDSKYNTGGSFLWARDSQNLIFSVTQYDESEHDYVSTSIILWDKDKPETTLLIKDHKEVLVPIEWIDETRILLQVIYENETRYELDLKSGELKPMSS